MKNRHSFNPTRWLGSFLLLLFALPVWSQTGSLPWPGVSSSYGIVALSNTNSIRVLRTADWSITEPLLTGELGSFGGGLFDVAITPDSRTALISNFGDSKVFFLDMTVPTQPSVKGFVDMGFFAEDIDITPNGRFALVTDGGFSPRIGVIDIAAMTVRTFQFDAPDAAVVQAIYCNAVAIMADGQTVLTADYFTGSISVFLLAQDGNLTHTQTHMLPTPVSPATLVAGAGYARVSRPVNVAVSPNGLHIAAVCPGQMTDPDDPDYGGPSVFLFKKVAPGQIVYLGDNGYEMDSKNPQCAVFSREGNKLFVSATSITWPTPTRAGDYTRTFARIFKINNDALVLEKDVQLPGRGTSQLFGVDTMAIDQTGNFLFVTNPTLSGGIARIDVVSLVTKELCRSYKFPDQTYTDDYSYLPEESRPDPVTRTERPIPTGITFTKLPSFPTR